MILGKVVVLSWPFLGHINLSLGIVRELVNRGKEVIYYATRHYKDLIEETGYEDDLNAKVLKHALLSVLSVYSK